MQYDFLYKYRGVDNEVFDRDIEALKNNYVWSSDVEHLNDDQEFQFNLKDLVNTLDALRLKHPRCYQSIDNVSRHEIPASALCGIIFGSQMSEKDKQKIKDALVGRNVKFYQLRRKVDAYGYDHCLVDENKVCSPLDDSLYDYKCKSMPVVDNFFVKLKFMPSSEAEVKSFISEFKKKHADKQCNIYVHDMDVDMEKFKEDYENYDYLQKHLIAEVYFDSDEVLFNSEYRKIW